MINCYFGIYTGKQRPISEQKAGLNPDCALEEGKEDVRDGLNGAKGDWVTATVHPLFEGEGTGLALREVGWTDTCSGCELQQFLPSVSAGEEGLR